MGDDGMSEKEIEIYEHLNLQNDGRTKILVERRDIEKKCKHIFAIIPI